MRDKAIRNTHSTVVAINADTEAWDNNGNLVTLDEALITAEITRLQGIYDSKQYARDRAEAYPSLQDQADMQYWDSVNDTTAWADAIAAVKAEFPKP